MRTKIFFFLLMNCLLRDAEFSVYDQRWVTCFHLFMTIIYRNNTFRLEFVPGAVSWSQSEQLLRLRVLCACICVSGNIVLIPQHIYRGSKKRPPPYSYDCSFYKCWPISIIFGVQFTELICNVTVIDVPISLMYCCYTTLENKPSA